MEKEKTGTVLRVAGPVVTVGGVMAAMYEVVLVGHEGLLGEVVQILGDKTVVQVYEDTTGIRPGEPVKTTGASLSLELGPGILTQIYDGIQRPLPGLADTAGDFLKRGIFVPGLDHEKLWKFEPLVSKGDIVGPGGIVGKVQETPMIEHRIMALPTMKPAKVVEIRSGNFTIDEVVCVLEVIPDSSSPLRRQSGEKRVEIKMHQKWPVRNARPSKERLPCDVPLLTGQRVVDSFFPLAKGGAAAIPGPFGSGKTVTQQQLARWSDAQIVVYIGCGERGNEMTEVLTEFPELKDPHSGRPLMERTILIANTSNMPVAAREASVYTGMTIAEYFRDMGYDVALMADSTSRWAEAMREISSRLEEMPGEEGYPAYLATRLAQFYERAGSVRTCNGQTGSITAIGAVSPPGGDLSEPVTQNTLRIAKVFFGLDAKLAHRRHFPSINWLTSYTLYLDALRPWHKENVAPDFPDLRTTAMAILQKESELQDVVQLVGADALPANERLILETGRLLREVFLQQNAYHAVDAYCPVEIQAKMLRNILLFHEHALSALKKGAPLEKISQIPSLVKLARARFEEQREEILDSLTKEIPAEISTIQTEAAAIAAAE